MAFKKININRNEILHAIKAFDRDFSIETKEESSFLKYFINKGSEVVSKINVYPTPDGKTTISWQECKNPALSEEIASHIVKKCKFPDELNSSIYIKKSKYRKIR